VDRSRLDARTVAVALLCVAVLSFAAATLDTTTDPDSGIGFGGSPGDQSGNEGTPTPDDTGSSDDGRSSVIEFDGGGTPLVCVSWLNAAAVQGALLLGLFGVFLAGRWYDDELFGLGLVFLVGYPGLLAYLVLTACNPASAGLFPDLSRPGSPDSEAVGGLVGGSSSVTSPTLLTQLLLVVVVGVLGVVALVVLTGDHDQLEEETADEPAEPDPQEQGPDVAAIGAAAGRAADRLERDGDFENDVYRAWAEMTEPLSGEHPESSTPGEFAAAAVRAGVDPEDVDRLTDLFAQVRYGGAEPTAEREQRAVETLRRVEETYAETGERS